MIISNYSELRMMELLIKKWYESYSVYELSGQAGMTAPTAYKVIKKLLQKKIIVKEKSRIKVDFNNLISCNFKLFSDSDRLYQLNEKIVLRIINIFDIMRSEYGNEMLAFLVIGSAATGELHEESDIDLLLLVSKRKEIEYEKRGLLKFEKINIIEMEKKEFEEQYLSSNDFIIGALMNGMVLFDSGFIRFFLTRPLPKPSHEIIIQKKERLDKMKKRLLLLLKDRDYKNLINEFKSYLIEKARIILLQKGIIPSSKVDIINRIRKIEKSLYELYKTVNEKNISKFVLEE